MKKCHADDRQKVIPGCLEIPVEQKPFLFVSVLESVPFHESMMEPGIKRYR